MINVDNALWLLMEKDPTLKPYVGEIRMHLDRYNDCRNTQAYNCQDHNSAEKNGCFD